MSVLSQFYKKILFFLFEDASGKKTLFKKKKNLNTLFWKNFILDHSSEFLFLISNFEKN